MTEGRVGSISEGWIQEAADSDEQVLRTRLSAAPRGAMELFLAGLESRYGGAAAYLENAGVDDETLDRVVARLR